MNAAGLQCSTAQGVFPEINRAWFTIDSDVFIWDLDDGLDRTLMPISIMLLSRVGVY